MDTVLTESYFMARGNCYAWNMEYVEKDLAGEDGRTALGIWVQRLTYTEEVFVRPEVFAERLKARDAFTKADLETREVVTEIDLDREHQAWVGTLDPEYVVQSLAEEFSPVG